MTPGQSILLIHSYGESTIPQFLSYVVSCNKIKMGAIANDKARSMRRENI
jgi:hypothetical protein